MNKDDFVCDYCGAFLLRNGQCPNHQTFLVGDATATEPDPASNSTGQHSPAADAARHAKPATDEELPF